MWLSSEACSGWAAPVVLPAAVPELLGEALLAGAAVLWPTVAVVVADGAVVVPVLSGLTGRTSVEPTEKRSPLLSNVVVRSPKSPAFLTLGRTSP